MTLQPVDCMAVVVSIVIPAFNAGGFVEGTLDSVRNQTLVDWELVVVDDGSTDATPRIVERFAREDRRVKLVRQANAGMAVARNVGYGATDPASTFVAFLDADDVWRPRCLELLLRRLSDEPRAPAAQGRVGGIDGAGSPVSLEWFERLGRHRMSRGGLFGVGVTAIDDEVPTSFDTLVVWNPIATPGQVLLRRTDFEAVGGFDPLAERAADWDLWLRLAMRGPIAYVPELVLDYRQHDTNASNVVAGMRQDERYVRFKMIASPALTPAMRCLMRCGLRRAEVVRARERLALAIHAGRTGAGRKAALELGRAGASLMDIASSLAPPGVVSRCLGRAGGRGTTHGRHLCTPDLADPRPGRSDGQRDAFVTSPWRVDRGG